MRLRLIHPLAHGVVDRQNRLALQVGGGFLGRHVDRQSVCRRRVFGSERYRQRLGGDGRPSARWRVIVQFHGGGRRLATARSAGGLFGDITCYLGKTGANRVVTCPRDMQQGDLVQRRRVVQFFQQDAGVG